MKVCKKCKHLMPWDEVHVCPSAEYEKLRDEIISAAAEYDEQYDEENNFH